MWVFAVGSAITKVSHISAQLRPFARSRNTSVSRLERPWVAASCWQVRLNLGRDDSWDMGLIRPQPDRELPNPNSATSSITKIATEVSMWRASGEMLPTGIIAEPMTDPSSCPACMPNTAKQGNRAGGAEGLLRASTGHSAQMTI